MRFRPLNLFLLAAALTVLTSCGPQRSKGDQKDEKSEIITSLNRGDNHAALAKIEKAIQANPGDLELHYFKAQVLASMTGIDVYNLFDVARIKLFEVAMTEWQSYQRYKYLTEHAAMNGFDPTSQGDAIAAIDIMLGKIDKMKPEEVTLTPIKRQNVDYSKTCWHFVDLESDIFLKLDPDRRVIREDDDYFYSNYQSYPIGDTCTEEEKKSIQIS